MFSNPTTGGSFDIEPGKYYVKVSRLEPVVGGQFGDQVKWTFEVATLQGEVLTEPLRGLNLEFWQWSSPKISTGGKRPSKAYQWGEALLPGTDLMALTGEEFGQLIVGKKAVALIGENESGRVAILSMSPIPTKNGSAAKASGTKPTPVAAPEEPPDDPDLIEADAIEAEARDSAAAPW